MSIEELKAQYPKIAEMTVSDVVNSEYFKKSYNGYVGSSRFGKYYYAAKSLKAEKLLEFENFKKCFLECIDKNSNLSFAKRVVIYQIGNEAYAKAIKLLIENYDKL